jgi:hypothetical protein
MPGKGSIITAGSLEWGQGTDHMLLYGGIGLLAAGVISMLFSDKLTSDAAKAAQLKKQGPIIAVVGAVFLLVRVLLG